jgi:phenol 2-monooxygenase
VRARYVIGCDGARSAVRGAIGGALHGDAANQAWGVIDVLAVTDFPDWRMKSFVRSQDEGILMVLPREGGHLVRLYVELDKLASTSAWPTAPWAAGHHRQGAAHPAPFRST